MHALIMFRPSRQDKPQTKGSKMMTHRKKKHAEQFLKASRQWPCVECGFSDMFVSPIWERIPILLYYPVKRDASNHHPLLLRDGKGTSPFYLYKALYVRDMYSSFVYKNEYCISILDTYPTVMPSTDLPLVGVGSCSTSSIFVVLVLPFI